MGQLQKKQEKVLCHILNWCFFQLPREKITSCPKQFIGIGLEQTCCFSEVLKELLVEDEGHTADLLHFGLCCRVPVDEVSSDGDGELAPELLAPKPWGKILGGHESALADP